jgi:uncharacterized protein
MNLSPFPLKRVGGIVLGMLLLLSTARAASFDCGKAASEVEKVICGNDELSKLDEDLFGAYTEALKLQRTDLREQAIKSQEQWLKDVRDTCRNAACLRKAYETRIEELDLRKVEVYCDPESTTLIIVAVDDFAHFTYPLSLKQTINWGSLLTYSKKKSDPDIWYREGSKSVCHKCGEFRVFIEAGFWNSNPDGEDGAYEFPIVQISEGDKELTPPITLMPCNWNRGYYRTDPPDCRNTAVAISIKRAHRTRQTIITYTRLEDRDDDVPQDETTSVPD